MKKTVLSPFVVVLAVLGLSLSAAHAQSNRTFVSAEGADSNPCSRSAPCRTLAQAITVTTAGGEIIVIDSGGYGPVTITQAVSIINDGEGVAGVSAAAGGNAITINAGAGNAVVLKGLTIDGYGSAANGIVFNSGGVFTIDNCVIQNFAQTGSSAGTGNGVLMQPSGSGGLGFAIVNSLIARNGNVGIYYLAPAGAATGVQGNIDHVNVVFNSHVGISIDTSAASSGFVQSTISNSVVANNGNSSQSVGILYNIGANTAPPFNSIITVDQTYVTYQAIGIYAQGNASTLLSRSLVTFNQTGINNQTSTFYSYGDNRINLNGTDIAGNGLNETLARPQ